MFEMRNFNKLSDVFMMCRISRRYYIFLRAKKVIKLNINYF